MSIKLIDSIRGEIGNLHIIDTQDTVLIFQMPRYTKDLSAVYVEAAKKSLAGLLNGRKALLVGMDVDIYSICGEDATALILKGYDSIKVK